MFFSLRWRPTTWWGPDNPPSWWRLSASLESLDTSSGRQFSIWAAPKMLQYFLEFISINFFQEQGQDHNEQTGQFSTCWNNNQPSRKKASWYCPQVGHMLRTKLSHVNEGGVAAGMHIHLHIIVAKTYGKRLLNLSTLSTITQEEFASNNSRSRCPWLAVPGRCQELLPSTVWSHQMIWHGVRNWYHLCSIVEHMICLMSSNNSRSRCPCPRQPPDDLTWGSVVFWSRWFEQMCHFTFLAWNKENKHGRMESQSTKTKIKSVSRLSFN